MKVLNFFRIMITLLIYLPLNSICKSRLIIVIGIIAYYACLISCSNTYEKRFNKCLEGVEIREYTIVESGEKGYGYSNTNPNCLIGSPLPKFKTLDINNNLISTKSIKGKYNIINFWLIKCRPCIEEIPDLNALTKKYSKNHFNFLAFTLDSPGDLIPFLDKNPFNFRIIPNAKELMKNKFHVIYGFPFTIITNDNNVIIGVIQKNSPVTIINQIDSLLGQIY